MQALKTATQPQACKVFLKTARNPGRKVAVLTLGLQMIFTFKILVFSSFYKNAFYHQSYYFLKATFIDS